MLDVSPTIHMQDQHSDDSHFIPFSPIELFDYASGDLEKDRAEELKARAAVDDELAAKIRFYRFMALGITEDEDGDDEKAGH
jgi:hypothetical protein